MRLTSLAVLFLVSACVGNAKKPRDPSLSFAQAAVTIQGHKCELTFEDESQSSVFIQRLSRMDESRTLSLRNFDINEEVPAQLGFTIAGVSLTQPFELSAYTPDSQDELPYSLGSIQSNVEIRLTESLDGALYTRAVELDEEGHEWVTITKVADVRDCQEIAAVVGQ